MQQASGEMTSNSKEEDDGGGGGGGSGGDDGGVVRPATATAATAAGSSSSSSLSPAPAPAPPPPPSISAFGICNFANCNLKRYTGIHIKSCRICKINYRDFLFKIIFLKHKRLRLLLPSHRHVRRQQSGKNTTMWMDRQWPTLHSSRLDERQQRQRIRLVCAGF